MSDEAPPPTEKSTLWQRMTNGVKNFFSHALGYLPRGIAFTGLILASSAALESLTGATLLGVSTATPMGIASTFGIQLAIGSVLSGVLGATLPECKPCAAAGGADASHNPLLSKRETQLGEYLAKTMGDQAAHTAQTAVVEAVAPGAGLPAHLLKTLSQGASK